MTSQWCLIFSKRGSLLLNVFSDDYPSGFPKPSNTKPSMIFNVLSTLHQLSQESLVFTEILQIHCVSYLDNDVLIAIFTTEDSIDEAQLRSIHLSYSIRKLYGSVLQKISQREQRSSEILHKTYTVQSMTKDPSETSSSISELAPFHGYVAQLLAGQNFSMELYNTFVENHIQAFLLVDPEARSVLYRLNITQNSFFLNEDAFQRLSNIDASHSCSLPYCQFVNLHMKGITLWKDLLMICFIAVTDQFDNATFYTCEKELLSLFPTNMSKSTLQYKLHEPQPPSKPKKHQRAFSRRKDGSESFIKKEELLKDFVDGCMHTLEYRV